ncbi:MAG: DUF2145 domain-containing protein [Pseudomonadota bacterium]
MAAISHTSIADSGSGGSTFKQAFSPEEAAVFSKSIEKQLGDMGARVAIVFRTGRTRDKLPDGINYTHGGFWTYQAAQTPSGDLLRGYVAQNLFHGDGETLPKTQSYLDTDFPFEFVGASSVRDLGVIIPTPVLQRRILKMMEDGQYSKVHDPDYSLIASPFNDRFQNCNEFILDVIAAAVWDTTDYSQIKANLSEHFKAGRIKTGLLARVFGPLADERIKLADHRGKPIYTVTFDSLATFMLDNNLAQDVFIIEPEGIVERRDS